MRVGAVVGLVSAVLVGCALPDDPIAGPVARDGVAALAKAGKVDVCHRSDTGWQLLGINANALTAHQAHGDALPGQPVPGDPARRFDAACHVVAAVACPCQFTLDALRLLNAQYGDLGSTYVSNTSSVVTQLASRADVVERRLNRFVIFQAPGPDWPQAFVCVTRVYEPGFAILSNEELPVTPAEAKACVDDINALAHALGLP